MLRSAAAGGGSSAVSAKSQLIELTPFDVQIARSSNSTAINEVLLMNVITNWMTDGFNQSVASKGLLGYSTFQSILLTQLGQRMLLEEDEVDGPIYNYYDEYNNNNNDWERDLGQQQIFTVSYQIYSVWLQHSGDSNLPNAIIVGMEGQVLLDPNKKLLTALQHEDSATGLGSAVTNVWAFLLPTASTGNNSNSNGNAITNVNTNSGHNSNNFQLEVIIIVAVVVAGVALSVLSLAVVWAWRQDRKRRDPYRRGGEDAEDGGGGVSSGAEGGTSSHSKRVVGDPKRSHAPSPDGTGSSSSPPRGVSAVAAARIVSPPPSEIEHSENGGGVYEESLISEDISTSLSAYYRSGLAAGSSHTNNNTMMTLTSDHFGSNFHNNNNHPDQLNDAASLSSMESYGYSLDGYNSITGASLQVPSHSTKKTMTTTSAADVMPSAGEIRRVIDED